MSIKDELPDCKEILTSFSMAMNYTSSLDNIHLIADAVRQQIIESLSNLELKEAKPRALWVFFGELK